MLFGKNAVVVMVAGLMVTGLMVSICGAQSPVAVTAEMRQHADAMIAKMSLEEKLDLLGGQDSFYTHAVPSIGLQRLKMSDGPVGVRTYGPTTAYTAGVALAASWDPALAERVGASLGADARARGVNFLLAPGVNIYRSPLNGRNMEYLGEDPYLAGRVAVGYIDGVQSMGVSATVKHFAANNSEFDRHNINAIIDERTLRELYLPAFEAAVTQGHVGAVMDSYNLVNGEHSTQNGHLNNDILKKDWGFEGVVMSDWTATYDGVAAANGGLDLEMPFAKLMTAETLKAALKDGRVTQATIDDKVRRILLTAMRFGWMGRDQYETSIPLYRLESDHVALDEARESITLLKNEGSLLPLDAKKIKTIAIVGPEAAEAVVGGGGSSRTTPFKADSYVAGFASYLVEHGDERVKVMYASGLPPLEELFNLTNLLHLQTEKRVGDGKFENISGNRDRAISHWHGDTSAGTQGKAVTAYRWSGEYMPSSTGSFVVLIASNAVDSYTVTIDDKKVLAHEPGAGQHVIETAMAPMTLNVPAKVVVEYETHSAATHIGLGIRSTGDALPESTQAILRNADAVLVTAGFGPETESEGFDRTYAMPERQNELIEQVAALNPHTIVAVTAGGAVETAPWIDKVQALVDDYYPGQEGALAMAEIVFGERSPSGHLPFSWERSLDQNPVSAHYDEENGGKDSHYAEGLYVGYRYYTSMHKEPLFPFGFGLSYTQFALSGLAVKRVSGDDVEVSFDVQNKGEREGAEVAQIYVGDPSATVKRPVMELKQFARVELKPGARQHVVLHLDRRAFEYYDVASKGWKLDPGTFTVFLGESSASIAQQKDFSMM
jgi:beta-glucosidase